MTFGVTPTGFNPKLIGDILDDIEAKERAAFGSTIYTHGESFYGQLNATFAASVAEGWEVLNAVYRSIYPDSATGEALDNVSAITGVTREPATHSTVTLTCTGTAGTFLLAGRVISVDTTGTRWVSTEDATIPGSGTIDVPFESEEFGPITLTTGQALTIETPVVGWADVTAGEDAVTGQNLETDAELRLRRVELLRAQGAATIEAIRADLLLVDGVTQVFVYENVSLVTDGRNLPGKSIEAIVDGGSPTNDQAIADALFLTKSAGIETYGHTGQLVTKTVTDSMGIDHTIKYTRPDPVTIYVEIDINVNAATYAGDAAVRQAIVDFGNTLGVGVEVISERIQAEVFSVSGVVDLTDFKIDDTYPPSGTGNIPITTREVSRWALVNISVVSTAV